MTHQETIRFLMNRVKASDFRGNYRLCPYPGTEKLYHTNKVHVLICKSCKFRQEYKWHGGVSCNYGKDTEF